MTADEGWIYAVESHMCTSDSGGIDVSTARPSTM
jgi:hypothetical protein